MNRSVLWCFVPSLCVLSLLAVVILLEMDSLSTILIPVSTGPVSVQVTARKKVMKKIKVRKSPFGQLIDMRGNIITSNLLTHPKTNEDEVSKTWNNQSGLPHALKFPISQSHTSNDFAVQEISESEDINNRGKWQMEQVTKYCVKHKKARLALTLPLNTKKEIFRRKNLFRHLIFDDHRKLIFCFIPKVGCTNMRRFLFVLQGIIPKESINWKHVSEDEYLGPGVQKASFLNHSLTESQRIYKIRNYWKFIILRNPLERLLSAFLNKLSSPLKRDTSTWGTFDLHKWQIMEIYHPEELRMFKIGLSDKNLTVNFETFLKWIIDTPNYKLNEHFAPTVEIAQPCRIRYNFYGNFRMYSSDMKLITERLGVPHNYFFDRSSHKAGRETKDLMEAFYSQVSVNVKRRLIEDISEDMEFYYTLFPDERGNHLDILGLRDYSS